MEHFDRIDSDLDGELGTVLAIANTETTKLLDAETGRPRWRAVSTGPILAQAIGRIDGTDVFAFSRENGIELWDLSENAPYGPGIRHAGAPATALAIGALGAIDVILSSHFATVRAWNARTGRLMSELPFGTNIEITAEHFRAIYRGHRQGSVKR